MKRYSLTSWLNRFALLALLLTLIPTHLPAAPQAVVAGLPSSVQPVAIGLREHGPIPETAVATVGQPVVWTNQGTGVHSVTEGLGAFRVYLPLVLRPVSQAPNAPVAAAIPTLRGSLFDSGPIAPGEQFT